MGARSGTLDMHTSACLGWASRTCKLPISLYTTFSVSGSRPCVKGSVSTTCNSLCSVRVNVFHQGQLSNLATSSSAPHAEAAPAIGNTGTDAEMVGTAAASLLRCAELRPLCGGGTAATPKSAPSRRSGAWSGASVSPDAAAILN